MSKRSRSDSTSYDRTDLFVVTGATSGIGRATAAKLASMGAHVVATGRKQDALDELAKELGGSQAVTTISGDICSNDTLTAIVDVVASHKTARLRGVVHSAGVIATGKVEDTTDEAFSAMMDVNVNAPMRLTRRLIPRLKQDKGAIVFVSSVTGTRSFPGIASYCVSKAAVDQLMRCLSLELAADGVRVNGVNPGVIVTNLYRRGGMDDARYAAFLEHTKTTHPLGRAGTADEVADSIEFLLSDRASYITGMSLAVDGGRAQTCFR